MISAKISRKEFVKRKLASIYNSLEVDERKLAKLEQDILQKRRVQKELLKENEIYKQFVDYDILSNVPLEILTKILCYLDWETIGNVSRISATMWKSVRNAAKYIFNEKGQWPFITELTLTRALLERHVTFLRESAIPSEFWKFTITKTRMTNLRIPKNLGLFVFHCVDEKKKTIDLAQARNLVLSNADSSPNRCAHLCFFGQESVKSVYFRHYFPCERKLNSFSSLDTLIVKGATLMDVDFDRGCERAVFSMCNFRNGVTIRGIKRVYVLGCTFGMEYIQKSVQTTLIEIASIFMGCGSIIYFRADSSSGSWKCNVYRVPDPSIVACIDRECCLAGCMGAIHIGDSEYKFVYCSGSFRLMSY